MENLQQLEPRFQELLQHWYQLTLDNKEYAIFLVVSACLLMAIFYSLRIGFLKRKHAKTLSAKNAIQVSLDETNEQLHTLQQQYDETNELKQQAEQKAETETQHLQASNSLLAGSLSRMVDCFELNQPNLPSAGAENLLTEYKSVLASVFERFQNEQETKTQLQLSLHSESAKLAEKEMLATSLQNRLDSQAAQLSKLETAVEQFETAQRQLEADKERLAKEMEMRHAQAMRDLELEKQNLAADHEPVQEAIIASSPDSVEPAVSVDEPEIIEPVAVEPVEKEELVETPPEPETDVLVSEAPEIITAPLTETNNRTNDRKKKGLFGRTIEKFINMDEKLGSSGKDKAVSEPSGIERARKELSQFEIEAEAHKPDETSAEKPHQGKNLNEKLTGLLEGFKKSSDNKADAEKPATSPSASVEPEQNRDKAAQPSTLTSRLTGLVGKFQSKK